MGVKLITYHLVPNLRVLRAVPHPSYIEVAWSISREVNFALSSGEATGPLLQVLGLAW